jgi:hypothetical protein
MSAPCRPDSWFDLAMDELERLYDREITAILEKLVPVRAVRHGCRAPDPWFDQDCCVAKRRTRQLERQARLAGPAGTSVAATATAAWVTQRRAYRELLRRKRESFWQAKIEAASAVAFC